MGSKTTRAVWVAVFATSVIMALVLVCELKGISILPATCQTMMDRSLVTKLILIVFAISLAVNARNTLSVLAEFTKVRRGLRSDPSSSRLKLVGEGLLGQHAARMHQIYGHAFEGDVSQAVSLGLMRSRLYRNEWFVRSASQLLLTLGLIGTVVGLASSLDGLSLTIRSMATADADHSNPATVESEETGKPGFTSGLHAAVSGMAAAFATTLFGAIFGGIFLRLLSNCTQHLAEDLVDEIEITSETELVPLLRATQGDVAARRREMLAYMDETVEKESARLKIVSDRIEAITRKFDALADSMAKMSAMS
jgi:hypothetical protein